MVGINLKADKLLKVLHHELERESKHRHTIRYGSLLQQDERCVTSVERDRIVSLLLALSKQFAFHPEVFALSTNILDRFLHLIKAQKKYLPCIAIACLFLASKINEEEEDLPRASELIDASGYSFSVSDLLRMERVILRKLEWNLHHVTPLSFLQAIHALSVVNGCVNHFVAPYHLQLLTHKMELLMCSNKFLAYRPSTLALALFMHDLNSSLGQWLAMIQSFQSEIKVPEWELNACFVAVSNFLNVALDYEREFYYEYESIALEENRFIGVDLKIDKKTTSNLIRALALETTCALESADETPREAKTLRLLSTVA